MASIQSRRRKQSIGQGGGRISKKGTLFYFGKQAEIKA